MARSTFIGLVAAVALACWTGASVAQESSVVVEGPEVVEAEQGPEISPEPAPAPEVVVEKAPHYVGPDAAPAIHCRPIRVLREHATGSARRMYRCYGKGQQQVLCVKNPSDCCYYGVCVCVPACCTGEPVVCGTKVGLLGRGYVTYRWPCGFEARITFRVHGGALVKYM